MSDSYLEAYLGLSNFLLEKLPKKILTERKTEEDIKNLPFTNFGKSGIDLDTFYRTTKLSIFSFAISSEATFQSLVKKLSKEDLNALGTLAGKLRREAISRARLTSILFNIESSKETTEAIVQRIIDIGNSGIADKQEVVSLLDELSYHDPVKFLLAERIGLDVTSVPTREKTTHFLIELLDLSLNINANVKVCYTKDKRDAIKKHIDKLVSEFRILEDAFTHIQERGESHPEFKELYVQSPLLPQSWYSAPYQPQRIGKLKTLTRKSYRVKYTVARRHVTLLILKILEYIKDDHDFFINLLNEIKDDVLNDRHCFKSLLEIAKTLKFKEVLYRIDPEGVFYNDIMTYMEAYNNNPFLRKISDLLLQNNDLSKDRIVEFIDEVIRGISPVVLRKTIKA